MDNNVREREKGEREEERERGEVAKVHWAPALLTFDLQMTSSCHQLQAAVATGDRRGDAR